MTDWRNHIASDPAVCHGQACIRGTRVLVSVILDNLASGEPAEAIASSYHVSQEDIQAALLYAAELAKSASSACRPRSAARAAD